MASRNIKICDWCKKEEEGRYDNGWKTIKLDYSGYCGFQEQLFDLCPDCLKKLGIVDKKNNVKDINEPTTYKKLFEIISDIVNDAIDNR